MAEVTETVIMILKYGCKNVMCEHEESWRHRKVIRGIRDQG